MRARSVQFGVTLALAVAWCAEPWKLRYDEGLSHLESGNLIAAQQAFQASLRLLPNSAEALNGLGMVALEQGENSTAVLHFETALRLLPDDAGIRYNLMAAYLAAGQPVRALQEADRLIANPHPDPELYRKAGELLFQYGHTSHAVQLYRAAQQSGIPSPQFEKLIAEADAQIARDAEELQSLEKQLSVMREEPAPYLQLGLLLIKLGQFARSEELLKSAAERFPDSPELLLGNALASYFTGQTEKAEREYLRLIHMRPESDQPQFALGNFYLDTGRLRDAIRCFRRAAARSPQNYLNAYMLGVSLFRAEDYPQAEAALNRALKLNPKHADSNFWLGKIYAGKGEQQKALAAFERTVSLEPRHIGAYYQLGLLYARTRQPEKSKQALERQRQLNTQLHKGLVAVRMP